MEKRRYNLKGMSERNSKIMKMFVIYSFWRSFFRRPLIVILILPPILCYESPCFRRPTHIIIIIIIILFVHYYWFTLRLTFLIFHSRRQIRIPHKFRPFHFLFHRHRRRPIQFLCFCGFRQQPPREIGSAVEEGIVSGAEICSFPIYGGGFDRNWRRGKQMGILVETERIGIWDFIGVIVEVVKGEKLDQLWSSVRGGGDGGGLESEELLGHWGIDLGIGIWWIIGDFLGAIMGIGGSVRSGIWEFFSVVFRIRWRCRERLMSVGINPFLPQFLLNARIPQVFDFIVCSSR